MDLRKDSKEYCIMRFVPGQLGEFVSDTRRTLEDAARMAEEFNRIQREGTVLRWPRGTRYGVRRWNTHLYEGGAQGEEQMDTQSITDWANRKLEQWRNFRDGDRVKCIDHPLAQSTRGRVGTFREYTATHGYARVDFDPKPEWTDQGSDTWLVHPEALEKIAQ